MSPPGASRPTRQTCGVVSRTAARPSPRRTAAGAHAPRAGRERDRSLTSALARPSRRGHYNVGAPQLIRRAPDADARTPAPHSRPRPPSRRTRCAVALILLVSTALRLWQLSTPAEYMFDEIYYAKDAKAIVDGRVGAERAATAGRPATRSRGRTRRWASSPSPPASVLFGDRAFGWRLPAVVAGIVHARLRVPPGTPARPGAALGAARPAVRGRRPARASRSRASPPSTSSSPSGRCSASCSRCATCRTAGARAGSSPAAPPAAWPSPPSGPAAWPSSPPRSSSSPPGSCSAARRGARVARRAGRGRGRSRPRRGTGRRPAAGAARRGGRRRRGARRLRRAAAHRRHRCRARRRARRHLPPQLRAVLRRRPHARRLPRAAAADGRSSTSTSRRRTPTRRWRPRGSSTTGPSGTTSRAPRPTAASSPSATRSCGGWRPLPSSPRRVLAVLRRSYALLPAGGDHRRALPAVVRDLAHLVPLLHDAGGAVHGDPRGRGARACSPAACCRAAGWLAAAARRSRRRPALATGRHRRGMAVLDAPAARRRALGWVGVAVGVFSRSPSWCFLLSSRMRATPVVGHGRRRTGDRHRRRVHPHRARLPISPRHFSHITWFPSWI